VLFQRYIRFIEALSINRIGRLGAVLTTSSFVTFFVLEAARFAGILSNAYIGLITYLSLPALFILGLVLIPIGWSRRRRETGKSTRELIDEQFDAAQTTRGFFGSKVFLSIGVLTLVNVVFMGIASTRMLHFMDSPRFCGTACHSVMNPEWVTYQESPHARVKCVECHVGEGVGALIDSKVSGTRQMISIAFDLLERPIPTPVHNLRPSRETCEKCHWPDKFYGRRLKTIARHKKDAESTPGYNTLSLKIDTGRAGSRSGIHWHVSGENEIRYSSVDDEREEMIWVDVRRPDGGVKRYRNRALASTADEGNLEGADGSEGRGAKKDRSAAARTLDCVDCHNRATHIYEDPNDAVDRRIELGLLDRALPFIKREALAAVTANYPDQAAAMERIAKHLNGFYEREYPEIARERPAAVDAAVEALRDLYRRNIHHQMNIGWNTYPSLIGHSGGGGCFRCHNPDMVDDEGKAVSSDCTMCHSILAYESAEPFTFVQPPDSASADFRMHEYLLGEFLRSSAK
jgi:nitrate/TMAO reductase-like tetraheme cytochrome c subunit